MKTQLRTGIIGVGAVVREIYQYLYFRSHYSDLLDLRAVADPNAEYRNWFCDLAGIPPERRFADYREMLRQVELDAVQVNTPDHLHCAPTVAALDAGLDVIVPKPTAATIKDTHAMIAAARRSGRFLGIDFHKREDPRFKEAEARYQNGRYGTLQTAVFYMIDKLLVADPNHSPRFFASADFAEKNTPISFLTVHMADALMKVVNLVPVRVRATGYAQKLPSLQPIAVQGYDTVDTEVVFQNGATAHIITGWAVPNSAHATTVQSGRLLCTDGVIDLGLDQPGLREIHRDGI
ncbi:MAG: Gfo/Idh/MocA family oxidoreductase, partial [Planctomycetia bacterium]|nr:Gfo/Idh/MocA family oxidoreductase [Planctomycetia bacterium]